MKPAGGPTFNVPFLSHRKHATHTNSSAIDHPPHNAGPRPAKPDFETYEVGLLTGGMENLGYDFGIELSGIYIHLLNTSHTPICAFFSVYSSGMAHP